MASPLDTVHAIYDAFGWQLDARAPKRAMAAYLARRPQGLHGTRTSTPSTISGSIADERASPLRPVPGTRSTSPTRRRWPRRAAPALSATQTRPSAGATGLPGSRGRHGPGRSSWCAAVRRLVEAVVMTGADDDRRADAARRLGHQR